MARERGMGEGPNIREQGGVVTASNPLRLPTGNAPGRRCVTQPALHDDLMARVLDRGNLTRAWKRVKANKGAPGIDGMTLAEFPAYVQTQWFATRQALDEGSYQPQPVRRVSIPKPGGGERLLGIPTVIDRVIQQAIAQVLTLIFDPDFSESSFGFRPNRSAHGALRQVQAYVQAGRRVAVDIDLAKFFDTVNHDILMARVARKVRDKRLLALIGRYLRADVMVGDSLQPSDLGTPQGGPLSPLLANILLDDLDMELERRGHRFARYADDMIILVKSKRAGERVMASVSRFLTQKLKLVVNADKSKVVPTNQCSFLGFTFKGAKLCWTEKAYQTFRHRVRQLTGRSWGVSMPYRLGQLRRYVRGWMGYFGISEYYRPIAEIDGWIRRRIRCCYWKRWRKTRTKVRNLVAIGTSLREAIRTGLSSKGPWHLSRTLATQTGMTNDWLKRQGLISVRDLWLRAHSYT